MGLWRSSPPRLRRESAEYGRRWCRLDPLREEAHRRLMELFVANGRHADALRQYRECVRILDEELGVPPLPETTALYHAVQSDRANLVQQPLEPPELPALPPRTPPSPLIGRAADLARMRSVYRQVGPDARLLIVDGEPGIGKTRLAEALVAEAVTAGAAILSARCYEGETSLAYAPIIQALQEALSDERLHERLNNLPAQHVAEAARLLPELGTDRPLPALPALAAPGAQFRFYEGLAQLLAALLDGPVPGIFWLDDVHWLDAASQELLLYLLHRWRKRPFLMLLCWRSEGLTPAHPLPLLAATLRRAGASETIHPERFTVAQVRDLLLDSGRRFAPDLPQRLFAEAEGLPFFVVEYLNALDPEDLTAAKLEAVGLPTSVRDLLHNRLARIGDVERQIVQAAAAIGHGFDAPVIEAASGRSAEETVGALELLAARGLLVEEPGRLHLQPRKAAGPGLRGNGPGAAPAAAPPPGGDPQPAARQRRRRIRPDRQSLSAGRRGSRGRRLLHPGRRAGPHPLRASGCHPLFPGRAGAGRAGRLAAARRLRRIARAPRRLSRGARQL